MAESVGPPHVPGVPPPNDPIPATPPAKVFAGFVIPTSAQHWLKTGCAGVVGAFAGAIFSAIQKGGLPADKAGWVAVVQNASVAAFGTALAYLKTSPADPPSTDAPGGH